MFHLQPRVHFKEVEIAIPINDELDRAGTGIAHGLRQRDGLCAHSLARRLIQKGRWRFFNDLLIAALDRAFALIEVNAIAVRVGQDLNFNMAGLCDEFFDENPVITKTIGRLIFRGLEPFARFFV